MFSGGTVRSIWMIDGLVDMGIAYLAPDGTVLSVHEQKAEEPSAADETQCVVEAWLEQYLSGLGAQFAIDTPSGTNTAVQSVPHTRIPIDRKSLLSRWPMRNAAVRTSPITTLTGASRSRRRGSISAFHGKPTHWLLIVRRAGACFTLIGWKCWTCRGTFGARP